jgi:hypothetical protein
MLHRLLVQVNRIPEANQIILSCLKKVDLMESLEIEARNVDTLPSGPRELIDFSIHELNLILFGCELRAFAGAKLVINVDGTVHVPIKEHGEITSTTSLRKTTACSKKLATMNMQAYLREFMKQIPVRNSLNYAGCLFTIVAPKLTKMYQPFPQYANELAMFLKQEFGPYEKDPVPIPSYSRETDGAQVENGDVEEGILESGPTRHVEPQAGASGRKKSIAYGSLRTPGGTKKEKVIEETEDLKTRKLDFNYFMSRLHCFSGDRAKLEAILEGFRAVTQGANGLRVFEKTIDFVAKAEQLTRRLVDIGCLLLTSSPDSFSRLTTLNQMQEYSVTQSEKKIQLTEVHRFHPQDYCDFLN